MEYGWNEEMEVFRTEVRAFIDSIQTPHGRARSLDGVAAGHAGLKRIRDELDRRGWVKMCWPVEFGG